jgi:hypothetical protein
MIVAISAQPGLRFVFKETPPKHFLKAIMRCFAAIDIVISWRLNGFDLTFEQSPRRVPWRTLPA